MSVLASLSLLLFLSFTAPPTAHAAPSQCDATDKQTLLRIKAEFGNPLAISSWDHSTDCCSASWDYISCNAASGQVLGLNFVSVNLSGPIPSSIASLPILSHVIFKNVPELTGPIPSSLANVTSLDTLIISHTALSGPIPNFLGTMSHLGDLELSYNRLSGPIPDIFMATTMNLYILDLSGNQLTGTIPPSIYSGSTYSPILYLSRNRLTGIIPPAFGSIDFAIIDLSHNQLTGDASFLFGSGRTTTAIDLSWNKLEFDMSGLEFGKGLAQLDVSHNTISGSIPKGIAGLKKLNLLDVSYNMLCGRILLGYGGVWSQSHHHKIGAFHFLPECARIKSECGRIIRMRAHQVRMRAHYQNACASNQNAGAFSECGRIVRKCGRIFDVCSKSYNFRQQTTVSVTGSQKIADAVGGSRVFVSGHSVWWCNRGENFPI